MVKEQNGQPKSLLRYLKHVLWVAEGEKQSLPDSQMTAPFFLIKDTNIHICWWGVVVTVGWGQVTNRPLADTKGKDLAVLVRKITLRLTPS